MNHTFKLALATMLLFASQSFFAQKIVTNTKAKEKINQNAEKQAKKSSDEYHAKLDNEQARLKEEQARLKKDQKRVEKHQKNLKKSERDLENSRNKITKLDAENQQMNSGLSSISDEEAQKQQIKIKKNELDIQKLKVKQTEQQKTLNKVQSEL